jgi:integrase
VHIGLGRGIAIRQPPMAQGREEWGLGFTAESGCRNPFLQILVQVVMTGKLRHLAALLVQPHPAAALLDVIVLDLHSDGGPDAGEGIAHQGDQNAVTEPEQGSGVDRGKQRLDSPATMNNRLVAATFHGIRRTIGAEQTMKKPFSRKKIVKILGALEGPSAAARNKALILIGFAGALRRSELAAIRVEHVKWHTKGITIKLPRSKTDQEGKGHEVEILWGEYDLTCPVMALENWLKIACIKDGFVFRGVGQYGKVSRLGLHPNSIGRLLISLVEKAKMDSSKTYGGHSLSAGFVTEALGNGATERQVMKQSRHTSRTMVRRYAREDQEDKQAAESKLSL